MFEALLSHAALDYPVYEILFGVADPSDLAIPHVLRLKKQFPAAQIQLLIGHEAAPNGKVGVLSYLAKHARYPVWVVNDSDIRVTPTYLTRVIEPLHDPRIGVVTCLYRARAHTGPAIWESLGISTDFMPSTLVAQLIGVREFGLGSTLAFRAADLERAGGFTAIGDYLADDYQLAKHITGQGKRALLSTYTVETSIGEPSWLGGWQHQLRWGRTIRASKGGGYAGLPLTHAGLWILLAFAAGAPGVAFALFALRLLSAVLGGCAVLGSRSMAILFWLAPLWDVYSFAVWIASYGGREVRWRDRVLQIDREGRIVAQ